MAHETARTHVVLPKDLMDAIDALVGRGERSKFLASAAEEKLRRIRLVAAAHRAAGSLKDIEVPGWETSESTAQWVHDARHADQERLDELHRS